MLTRALRLAENLAILSLLTGSAVAMRVSAGRSRRRRATAPAPLHGE
jgi:hypothetical protein